jgi:phage tail tube protein FII|nr:MAG TPA: tail tube protein [Caudoviricetes sp.]
MKTKIPNGLVNAEVYINGINELAGIGEVELPNIEYATVTSEQLGLTAEVEVPLIGHFKKLEAKIKIDTVDNTLIGFNNNEPLLVEFKGAYQYIDKITHGAGLGNIDATFKGMIKKFDGIKGKPGEKMETSFDIGCTYYKLTIGGKTIVEIDVLNNISNINGAGNSLLRRFLGLI